MSNYTLMWEFLSMSFMEFQLTYNDFNPNKYTPYLLFNGCFNTLHTDRCFCTDKIKALMRLQR